MPLSCALNTGSIVGYVQSEHSVIGVKAIRHIAYHAVFDAQNWNLLAPGASNDPIQN